MAKKAYYRTSVWLPGEAEEMWHQVKARSSLEKKSVGDWIWDVIKQALAKGGQDEKSK